MLEDCNKCFMRLRRVHLFLLQQGKSPLKLGLTRCHSDPPTTQHWGGGLKGIAGMADKGEWEAHSDPPTTQHRGGGLKGIAGMADKGEWEAHSDPPTTMHWGILKRSYIHVYLAIGQ